MKILFVDDKIDGHHIDYFKGIFESLDEQSVLINSQKTDGIKCKQYVCEYWPTKNVFKYLQFVREIKGIAKKESVDIIHFLTMDSFSRFFGLGLSCLRRYKLIGTYHKVRLDVIHKICLKMVAKRLNQVVVHSEYLGSLLKTLNVSNYSIIEYPCFHQCSFSSAEAKEYFGIDKSFPVIGCIGATRHDKGLDLVLDALENLDENYILLISGQPDDFDKDYIIENTKKLNNVILNLHYLNSDEYDASIAASDFIIIPYRKIFNGASGPLCEGVYNGKIIIGTDSGNIGFLINNYHLGYQFKCEDSISLREILKRALTETFVIDDMYRRYQSMLDPCMFQKSYKNLYNRMVSYVNTD